MTPSLRSGNGRRSPIRSYTAAGVLAAALACGDTGSSAPSAEFIVAAGDSTYWVRMDGSGPRIRGTPMVLARLEGRFRELYVVDDDRSFENALFVGQRLFQRDILTNDSTEVFRDSLIPSLAERYERENPDARPLGPDEEPGEEPATTATAEVSVIGVHGPYLSLEYHVDTTGESDDLWHMTRHLVVDLRTGKQVTLREVLGEDQADAAISHGRAMYRETVDSVRSARRTDAAARRAVDALGKFRFDPNSFAFTAPNGTLMVAFSAPGAGHGGEGFTLPMRPIAIVQPRWWALARDALPTSTDAREEHWARPSYTVKALYDTSTTPVRLVLADSAGREFPLGRVSSPVHRMYWLDAPPISAEQRAALTRAFDEATLYDEAARTALDPSFLAVPRVLRSAQR
ncbi:MAG: hypothetical protein ACREOK_12690 [Gemmatimonadaceae bacterium]